MAPEQKRPRGRFKNSRFL